MGTEAIVFIIVAIVVVAGIVWFISQRRASSSVDDLLKEHSEGSILAHRAIFLEARERLPVALRLTKDAIYYQNADIDASLDLSRVDEVEYDDETTTGLAKDGHSVIRVRSHGHVFEFMVTDEQCKEWKEHLAKHHMGEPGKIEAV